MSGTVYLVGAGPGAPDLLTLRAARLLAEADIVFHDALVHPDTLALAVRAERVAVGKRCGRHATAQRFINKRLVDAARTHRTVVRLKGGDPMLFGRAQEEIEALAAAGIPYVVVSGVTSALAAAADAGVSLTQRGIARSVAFVTPRVGVAEGPSTWADATIGVDTVAIYMGAQQAGAVVAALLARGRPPTTPVVLVENAGLPVSVSIATTLFALPLACEGLGPGPVMILVGEAMRRARLVGCPSAPALQLAASAA